VPVIHNPWHDSPAGGVLSEIALTTAVLVGAVMVPMLLVQGLLLGYSRVLDAFGWR
jgi:hypothetical protein